MPAPRKAGYSVTIKGGATFLVPASRWTEYWCGDNILCRFFDDDGTEVAAFINPLAIIQNFISEPSE